ncbi:hypothetical protein GH733_008600 [Mirounga leonina]|nr:hypothetical protein GH733_008600 [Mirounga leonina]
MFLRYSLNKGVTFTSEILEDPSGMASQDGEDPQRPHRPFQALRTLLRTALEGWKGHVPKSSEVEASGQIRLEFNFSDDATSKRPPLPRKLGERTGLKPSLQRPGARQENAPRRRTRVLFPLPGGSYNLGDPKFHPFVGGGEARPPERPWSRRAAVTDAPGVQAGAQAPAAEGPASSSDAWLKFYPLLKNKPQRPVPLAAETSGAPNTDVSASGSLGAAKLVELDSFRAPGVPVPGQSVCPQASRSVVPVVPIMDVLQHNQKDPDAAAEGYKRRGCW